MSYRFGPFRLDMDNACLWQGEIQLALRPKTFDLLTYLVRHAGELVTKDDLLGAVWPDTVISDGVMTTSMSELRKVLGETAKEAQFIATVHRRGDRFIAPVILDDISASPLNDVTQTVFPGAVDSPSRSLGFMNRQNDLHPYLFDQSVHTGVVRGSALMTFVKRSRNQPWWSWTMRRCIAVTTLKTVSHTGTNTD